MTSDVVAGPAGLLPADVPSGLFIGGEWAGAESGATLDVSNPSTGRVIGQVADATVSDALRAVDAASEALARWSATAPRDRAEILRRCFELMIENSERLAHLISLENGKALSDARGEVSYAAEFFRWYSEEAVRLIGQVSTSPSGASRIVVQHQPIGVCVLVTPWNFPAAMATRKLAPALAAGCTAVLKPAALTPFTALEVARIMEQAGVPRGVVNVITTSSSGATVDAMLHDPRVRKLSFTGSTEVGRVLLKNAADQVLKCSMELGGNAPVIVFEDADLEEALAGVLIAKMRNGGQACTAANRIFVHESIAGEFSQALSARIGAMRLGPGTDENTDVGPVVDQKSLDKVHELVEDALGKGAVAATGGNVVPGDGYFFEPTVLTAVPATADLTREEIFGPVAALFTFRTDDEVIEAANDTEYGLAAYVFTRDLKRGLAVSERLDFGMVGLNRGLVSDPAAPFGGVKQSGLGREGAHDGLLEFTETKYIATNW